jgi:hypothetical protein
MIDRFVSLPSHFLFLILAFPPLTFFFGDSLCLPQQARSVLTVFAVLLARRCRRDVAGRCELDHHGVVRSVRESLASVHFQHAAVFVECGGLLLGLSEPDSGVVDENSLVHSGFEVREDLRVAVRVDASSGDFSASLVVALHDALGKVDCSTATKGVAQPVQLHVSDLIRELSDEDTRHLFLGDDRGWGDELFGGVGDEGDGAFQSKVQGALRERGLGHGVVSDCAIEVVWVVAVGRSAAWGSSVVVDVAAITHCWFVARGFLLWGVSLFFKKIDYNKVQKL